MSIIQLKSSFTKVIEGVRKLSKTKFDLMKSSIKGFNLQGIHYMRKKLDVQELSKTYKDFSRPTGALKVYYSLRKVIFFESVKAVR